MINFNDNDLPVPSYPLIVELKNTKYGPNNFLTYVKGIAAASSITSKSAYLKLCKNKILLKILIAIFQKK